MRKLRSGVVLLLLAVSASNGYAQSSEVLEQERLALRLREISNERAQLGLAWPIAVTATGFGGSVALALSDLFAWGIARAVAAGEDHGIPDDDRRLFRNLGIACAGSALIGVGGLGWMIHRLRARHSYDSEIRSLRRRGLELAPIVGARNLGLSASF